MRVIFLGILMAPIDFRTIFHEMIWPRRFYDDHSVCFWVRVKVMDNTMLKIRRARASIMNPLIRKMNEDLGETIDEIR